MTGGVGRAGPRRHTGDLPTDGGPEVSGVVPAVVDVVAPRPVGPEGVGRRVPVTPGPVGGGAGTTETAPGVGDAGATGGKGRFQVPVRPWSSAVPPLLVSQMGLWRLGTQRCLGRSPFDA